MEKVVLEVSGMNCTACAVSVEKKIRETGAADVHVNFTTGEAVFNKPDSIPLISFVKGIEALGYSVGGSESSGSFSLSGKDGLLLVICSVFTLPLLLHMFFHSGILMRPDVQFFLALPVFIIGILRFGRSAVSSSIAMAPNMDVLIMTGALASFLYSIFSWRVFSAAEEPVLYFETTASIITLVLLGNYLEHKTVKETTTALRELVALKPTRAKRLSLQLGQELITDIDVRDVTPGDLLSVVSGDKIAADGLVIRGSGLCDEAMLSGESLPVEKSSGSKVFGGTIVSQGSMLIRVEKSGNATLLSQIIGQVKEAQRHKPVIQKLGDRVSNIFVPLVIVIALFTFFISHFLFDISYGRALMSAIAVLVISCPCALGLATPTAVMAGVGRATRAGILIRGGQTLELLSQVKTVVFDKTGTLTDGNFDIHEIRIFGEFDSETVKAIAGRLELHSNHPIARSFSIWASLPCDLIFSNVRENKGYGMQADDQHGHSWSFGSLGSVGAALDNELEKFDLFLSCNKKPVAAMRISDRLRPGAAEMIQMLRARGKEVVMISGDREQRCADVAAELGIQSYFSSRLPEGKTALIAELRKRGRVAMVGDGINDAPALASADVGISMSGATDVAISSAQVVLLQQGNPALLNKVFSISDLTMKTIRQNLFFSFFYNVLAIPVAAAGFLSPVIGALAMAMSDVVVVGNSIRLKYRALGR